MAASDARRALALHGVPFRPQGRDRSGLDCVGLCLAAYRIPADVVRRDYRIRGDHEDEVMASLLGWFRPIGESEPRAGDLLLLAVAADQLHLAVRTDDGFVHADARLRRVVHTPGDPPWPLIAVYRRRRK
jgi:murein DD-endopeptidase / murein LD-carboxypeptidase